MWIYGNRKNDYVALLLSGVLLLAVSQGLEGIDGSTAAFFRGLLVGLSIVCSVIGLLLYGRQKG